MNTMKILVAICLSVSLTTLCACRGSESGSLKSEPDCQGFTANFMSFNIRNSRNSDRDDGINNWNNRRDLVVAVFEEQDIQIAGLQEAYHDQIVYLEERLPHYQWTGVGRDDGIQEGEYSPIFYQPDVFRLIDSGTFWLSETPESICSVGWDAQLCRIATWGKFALRGNGDKFLFMNVHFDHMGAAARSESARLLLAKAAEIAGDIPAIIAGDFNFTPADEPYRIITAADTGSRTFVDTREASTTFDSNVDQTFHAYGTYEPDDIIDFIFIDSDFESLVYRTYEKTVDSTYPSDHYPVISRLRTTCDLQ